MKKVLTIAGSDCSGGAGIQADIKTIVCHKMYAMSAVTALTAQNTTGVYGICECPPELLEQQLACIFEDIYPDAVKIGMVSSPQIIAVIVKQLRKYQATNIVVDPVMVSTSKSRLLKEESVQALQQELIPLATVVTPNIAEAEVLAEMEIHSLADMEIAARTISRRYTGHILIKGGHLKETADDLLYYQNVAEIFPGERVKNENTHGTGCTLSSAIACNLAAGGDVRTSVRQAKEYITGALQAQLDLGAGNGPLLHTYRL